MNKHEFLKPAALATAVGGMIVGGALSLVLFSNGSGDPAGEVAEKKPLYWVAPMDPNYRRDSPGKSPMGMDLIPVYEDGAGDSDTGPGTIKISPEVVNNLGVRTGTVERQALHSEIVSVGYVKYDEERLIHIHPRVSGWVEKLHVKAAGDPVKKGAPLYSLYSPELVNAQEELLLAMNRNNARLIEAAKSRLLALQIPDSFIDNLSKRKKVQQTVTFYAPQDGVVDNLNIREGFYVKPGTTMLSIGALDEVWVEGEIFERQAGLIKLNDRVSMKLDYLPGKTWEGKVDYIYPTLDSKTRTVRLRLRFANPNAELKPNMFAQITVHADGTDQMLMIPKDALIRTGSQDRVVLALGEGRFKSIEVKTGRQDAGFIEIIGGLNGGESVVTSAQFLLDSESSKTSDFKRMHKEDEIPSSAWVGGEILELMKDHRMVRAQHEPVEVWGWPEMMMDFGVAESVDIDQLTPGTTLHMEITKNDDGSVEITGIHVMSPGGSEVESSEPEGAIDHSQMDHSSMGHGQMNQDGMDHSQMNHGEMEPTEMDHSAHQMQGEG
ncbi:efflux RND transporter periplasmic adaptor subunit [Teredinibacter turnerae]|uniref:efflux RND transporter periplasmic adaptor subunit n=1 Tax=Teredinibacter turnerae TaxID=2426 RepID=UPI00036319F0|nr:efflux RND transporter periplasmic adaptor subunit [Teredinibacter turnerae]